MERQIMLRASALTIVLLAAVMPALANDKVTKISKGTGCTLLEKTDVDKEPAVDHVCSQRPSFSLDKVDEILNRMDDLAGELGGDAGDDLTDLINDLDEALGPWTTIVPPPFCPPADNGSSKKGALFGAHTVDIREVILKGAEGAGRAAQLTVLLERVSVKTGKRKRVTKASATFHEVDTGDGTVMQAVVSKEFKYPRLKEEEILLLTWQTKGVGQVPAGAEITRFYDLGFAE